MPCAIIVGKGLTVTVSVVFVAHCPIPGVNVYVPDKVLLTETGLHVPEMPLFDITGRTGAGLPLHIAGTVEKVGIVAAVTVTFKVVCVAHWPVFGVNVYMPLVVLLTIVGDQVPVIPFNEVVGNTGAALPLQKGGIAANVGTVPAAETETINVVGKAH